MNAVLTAATGVFASSADAGVTTFGGAHNPAPWFAAAGPRVTTVSFDGFADYTVVTDQYLAQGVLFTQPGFTAYASGYSSGGWLVTPIAMGSPDVIQPTDGVRASFAAPMRAIALNHFSHSGSLQVTLFSAGQAVWSGAIGPNYSAGRTENPWEFAGLVSDQAFDAVWLTATADQPNYPGNLPSYSILIDSLYFSAVPTPGALMALAPGALCVITQRRRRSH